MRIIILISLLGLSACKQSYSLYSEGYDVDLNENYGPRLETTHHGEKALVDCENNKVLFQTCISYNELRDKGVTTIIYQCIKPSVLKNRISKLTCKKEYVFVF